MDLIRFTRFNYYSVGYNGININYNIVGMYEYTICVEMRIFWKFLTGFSAL